MTLNKNFISRYTFPGSITAYGAGNSDNLNSVKAGAGTIYIKDNTRGVPNEKLIIAGNTPDPLQRQTRTMITGTRFQFAEVTLKSMKFVPLWNTKISVGSLYFYSIPKYLLIVAIFDQLKCDS